MKSMYWLVGIFSLFMVTSCDLLNDIADGDGELTDSEIVEGLKKALEIGTDSASTGLSLLNGYYGDVLVKIPLPTEASNVRNLINSYTTLKTISDLVGLDNAFENVVLSVNRAAEDAAKEAAPIFKNAIFSLNISSGLDILQGRVPDENDKSTSDFDSLAATHYLVNTTYSSLTDAFAPKIDNSLDKDIVGSISATEAWTTMTSLYNSFANRSDVKSAVTILNLAGQNITLPSTVETNLGVFCTEKALDGLFFKVGQQEKKIRKDPFQWVIDIIRKVFGSVLGGS